MYTSLPWSDLHYLEVAHFWFSSVLLQHVFPDGLFTGGISELDVIVIFDDIGKGRNILSLSNFFPVDIIEEGVLLQL